MGGMGSGRHWHYDAKDTIESCRAIDVRRWKRDCLLTPHQAFGWNWSRNGEVTASIQVRTEPDRVILNYSHRSGGADWKDESYPVFLDWTRCNLGGQRPWFRCPTQGCHRRVAILFGGRIFACRLCHRLMYSSQREAGYDRAARRADKLRDKLGWRGGILHGSEPWNKPKGMHWKTFEQLCAKHDAFAKSSMTGMVTKFNLAGESWEDWV